MNLFKKDPESIFKIIIALILVMFSLLLIVLFELNDSRLFYKNVNIVDNAQVVPDKISKINTDILFIKLKSPSYAMSNFDVDPNTRVVVYLSNISDASKFVENVHLLDKASQNEVKMQYIAEIRGSNEVGKGLTSWEKLWKQKVTFIPDAPLKDKTSYIIKISPGYLNDLLQNDKISDYYYDFTTTDTFHLLNSNIPTSGLFQKDGTIKIIFTSPLNYESLFNNIKIEPSFEKLNLQITDKILTIYNVLSADTKYTIVIPSSTTDLYNRSLGEDVILEFKTSK